MSVCVCFSGCACDILYKLIIMLMFFLACELGCIIAFGYHEQLTFLLTPSEKWSETCKITQPRTKRVEGRWQKNE